LTDRVASSGVVCLGHGPRRGWLWVYSGGPLFWLYNWSWVA